MLLLDRLKLSVMSTWDIYKAEEFGPMSVVDQPWEENLYAAAQVMRVGSQVPPVLNPDL
ncbi:unnamed protein product [Cylicocyclus nassatus]|uniref:Uncharacterized protein n=1 Tax=Cylicocyclus nassatus TaxID=53992 RepID=A0AA36DQ37_CYLNA|nr:unnamed protein product [Cylicocyclus nassatus]